MVLRDDYHDWNYTIKDVAFAVKNELKDTNIIINKSAIPDKRSYRVDFSLYESLIDKNYTHKSIQSSISELINNIICADFEKSDFRNSHLIRLNTLNAHVKSKRIDTNLNWTARFLKN